MPGPDRGGEAAHLDLFGTRRAQRPDRYCEHRRQRHEHEQMPEQVARIVASEPRDRWSASAVRREDVGQEEDCGERPYDPRDPPRGHVEAREPQHRWKQHGEMPERRRRERLGKDALHHHTRHVRAESRQDGARESRRRKREEGQ